MSTDILGKVGQLTGTEFKNLRVSIGQTYATKVSLGNVVNTIDFTPYATKVSLGQTNSSVASNASGISALDTSKASKVSLNAYKTGSSIFDLLKATRAELGELKVTGKTTIVDTQTVEVSDNIIELNLASDGGETAQTSGIQINRGNSPAPTATDHYVEVTSVTNYNDGNGSDINGYWSFTNDTYNSPNFDTGSGGNPAWVTEINEGDNINIANNTSEIFYIYKEGNLNTSYETVDANGSWYFRTLTAGKYYYSKQGGGIEGYAMYNSGGYFTVITPSTSAEDKAKILWNDSTSKFELKVGTASADLDAKKIYYSNVFTQESNLPSASTYHGMFAHVHGTGKAYFSHAGAWHELISETGGQTINGNLTLTGDLAVSAGTNIKVNNVELGDFASFSNAFSNALS